MFTSCCPVSPCFLNLPLSMSSVRSPALQSYKKIYSILLFATHHRAHEWIPRKHTQAQILFFRFAQSTDLWTPWTLLCCVNAKAPVVQGRHMHYKTSDFLEGSIRGAHFNMHAHTGVYTLKWITTHRAFKITTCLARSAARLTRATCHGVCKLNSNESVPSAGLPW